MKIIVSVFMAAALVACGGKAKKSTTPDNKTGTTETQTQMEGTGGTTYGGTATPAAGSAAEPGL